MNVDEALRQRRIGVYGGTFDPPHQAHHALAAAAIAQHQLEAVLIMPVGQAWYKSRELTAAQHRLAMAGLAFADLPQVCIDPRETLRDGPSYTVDTLRQLQQGSPRAQLFLIMGQDQLQFFDHWHEYLSILEIATLLVALRADAVKSNAEITEEKSSTIPYLPIQLPRMAHSATQIRQLVAQAQPIGHLVKPDIARYIADHQLYCHPN